jgi:hypothetical protein
MPATPSAPPGSVFKVMGTWPSCEEASLLVVGAARRRQRQMKTLPGEQTQPGNGV